jgi:hypothetical protein
MVAARPDMQGSGKFDAVQSYGADEMEEFILSADVDGLQDLVGKVNQAPDSSRHAEHCLPTLLYPTALVPSVPVCPCVSHHRLATLKAWFMPLHQYRSSVLCKTHLKRVPISWVWHT